MGILLFVTKSIPALGHTQPPIQWLARILSSGVKRLGVKLTTHLHLAPKLRILLHVVVLGYAQGKL
jgi:hypothetical protein